MSYDVTIANHDFNYTYNLSGLFHNHIIRPRVLQLVGNGKAETGLQSIDGITGKWAALAIEQALESIRNELIKDGEIVMMERYNPNNGWGSVLGAVLFLSLLMAACKNNPRHIVRVT